MGFLHDDFFRQEKLLPPGCNIKIRFVRARDEFSITSTKPGYKTLIDNASLCSKCYCVKTVNGVKFSSKGVNKNAITQADLFDVYKSTLITKEPLVVKNRGIRQIGRNVVTYELQKRGLSYSYWKRIVQQDGISTKPLNIWL